MKVQHFYDTTTGTLSYLISDEGSRAAVLIDPVLDFDAPSGRTWTENADAIAAHIEEHDLDLKWVLETHPHADHLTAAPYFAKRFGAKTAVGAGITKVQEVWKDLLDLGDDFATDGSQFDCLLADGDTLEFGGLTLRALLTEGHTPSSMSYLIEDAIFVGDLVFLPDAGTARCDFPGGSAEQMWDSVHRLYDELPDTTRIYTNHDYQPGGRELQCCATVAEQKASNVHIAEKVSKGEFVALRSKLEDGKPVPRLLFPAVQVNIDGGRMPRPSASGTSFLKIPLNLL